MASWAPNVGATNIFSSYPSQSVYNTSVATTIKTTSATQIGCTDSHLTQVSPTNAKCSQNSSRPNTGPTSDITGLLSMGWNLTSSSAVLSCGNMTAGPQSSSTQGPFRYPTSGVYWTQLSFQLDPTVAGTTRAAGESAVATGSYLTGSATANRLATQAFPRGSTGLGNYTSHAREMTLSSLSGSCMGMWLLLGPAAGLW